MWAASARAAGFRTGDTPEVGAIACWDNGDMAMSPWLRTSNMTKIQIQEANYNGHRYIDNFRGWFDPTNPIWEPSPTSTQIKVFITSRKGVGKNSRLFKKVEKVPKPFQSSHLDSFNSLGDC